MPDAASARVAMRLKLGHGPNHLLPGLIQPGLEVVHLRFLVHERQFEPGNPAIQFCLSRSGRSWAAVDWPRCCLGLFGSAGCQWNCRSENQMAYAHGHIADS